MWSNLDIDKPQGGVAFPWTGAIAAFLCLDSDCMEVSLSPIRGALTSEVSVMAAIYTAVPFFHFYSSVTSGASGRDLLD